MTEPQWDISGTQVGKPTSVKILNKPGVYVTVKTPSGTVETVTMETKDGHSVGEYIPKTHGDYRYQSGGLKDQIVSTGTDTDPNRTIVTGLPGEAKTREPYSFHIKMFKKSGHSQDKLGDDIKVKASGKIETKIESVAGGTYTVTVKHLEDGIISLQVHVNDVQIRIKDHLSWSIDVVASKCDMKKALLTFFKKIFG